MPDPSAAEHSSPGQVTVRYWASARAAAGVEADDVAVSGQATLADLIATVCGRHDAAFARILGTCSVLVGDQPVGARDPAGVEVPAGSVVEFLPPFAGG